MNRSAILAFFCLALVAVAAATAEADVVAPISVAEPVMDNVETDDVADVMTTAGDDVAAADMATTDADVADVASSADEAKVASDSDIDDDDVLVNDENMVMSEGEDVEEAEEENVSDPHLEAAETESEDEELADADADARGIRNRFCYRFPGVNDGRKRYVTNCLTRNGCNIVARTAGFARVNVYSVADRISRCNSFRRLIPAAQYTNCVNQARRGFVSRMVYSFQCPRSQVTRRRTTPSRGRATRGRRYCANQLTVVSAGRACVPASRLQYLCRYRGLSGHALRACYNLARHGQHARVYNRRVCRTYTRTTRICQFHINPRYRIWQRSCSGHHFARLRAAQCHNYYAMYRNVGVRTQCLRHAGAHMLVYKLYPRCFTLRVAAPRTPSRGRVTPARGGYVRFNGVTMTRKGLQIVRKARKMFRRRTNQILRGKPCRSFNCQLNFLYQIMQ